MSSRKTYFLIRFHAFAADSIFAVIFTFIVIFLNFYAAAPVNARQIPPFPLKRCWENPVITKNLIYASDKTNDIFILTLDEKIQSINVSSGLINWSYELGGTSVSNFIVSENVLYIANVVGNGNKSDDEGDEAGRLRLRSLNAVTGVTLWSTKIDTADANVKTGRLKESGKLGNGSGEKIHLGQNENGIFLLDSNGNFAFVEKKYGKLEWLKKIDSRPIYFFDFSSKAFQNSNFPTETFAFQSADHKFSLITARTGETLYQIAGSLPATAALLDPKNLVTGDSKGDISLTNIGDGGKIRNLWSIKIGGSVSSVSPTGKGILITSLDNFAYLINDRNGKKIWKKRLSGRLLYKALVIEEKNISIVVENETAYFLSLETGRLLNQISLPPGTYFINSPVTVNNQYIFQTNAGVISFSDRNCL